MYHHDFCKNAKCYCVKLYESTFRNRGYDHTDQLLRKNAKNSGFNQIK